MEAHTLAALLKLRGIDPQPLYPVRTVADLLWCSPLTVRKLIRLGKLTAIRRGRPIIGIPHDALVVYLEEKNGGRK